MTHSIAWILASLYRLRRDRSGFLQASHHDTYLRQMALGCLDIMLTIPTVVLSLVSTFGGQSGQFPFWPGWSYIHSDWAPATVSALAWRADFWTSFNTHYAEWASVPMAIAFFLLFGLAEKARECSARTFWAMASLVGVKHKVGTTQFEMSAIVFQGDALGGKDREVM